VVDTWRDALNDPGIKWSHGRVRAMFDEMSDYQFEWQGFPVPLPDFPLVLNKRHPLRPVLDVYDYQARHRDVEIELLVGGPPIAADDYEEEVIVNSWFSFKLNVTVYVVRAGTKYFALRVPRSTDGAMKRLDYWLGTIGASDAWDQQAENKARHMLRSMLTERQYRQYDLTGSFLETSERSRLTYVFRRLRPTVALTPRNKPGSLNDHMRCLAVLCMHPIGYYQGSWGGCLVPTDDVIAHLTYMRGDEAGFWKEANQHESWVPEAGL
jgi:hypothetical protein